MKQADQHHCAHTNSLGSSSMFHNWDCCKINAPAAIFLNFLAIALSRLLIRACCLLTFICPSVKCPDLESGVLPNLAWLKFHLKIPIASLPSAIFLIEALTQEISTTSMSMLCKS